MPARRLYRSYWTVPVQSASKANFRANTGMQGVWAGSGIVHSNPTRSAKMAPPIQGCRGGAKQIAPETPKIAPGDVKIRSMTNNQERDSTTRQREDGLRESLSAAHRALAVRNAQIDAVLKVIEDGPGGESEDNWFMGIDAALEDVRKAIEEAGR